ncbi:hypothetical protein [Arcobacter sp. FWKO B]|uniref:hypothetical protein n=1 Tax=Arcobacter sp. FWKO B TaxID=2593672 RepID=UPI0018A58C06|nr:hypothetical protein [Arcobacter sp. FWKO B]QOG11733.1 hypothetical protein FWKOB_03010 [Arcobacter sp. FWKO B]
MDIMASSLTTHLFTIYLLLGVMVFNLLTIINQNDFITMAKRIKFLTPIFHTLNAMVIYTGAIYAAFYHMFNFSVILMICASIAIMVLEIKRYKKLRVIKSTDLKLQEEFKYFAKKIYAFEIAIMISVYVIVKVI